MKFTKPVFLIAYPSNIKTYSETIALTDEKLTLSAEEKYFFKKEVFTKENFISTFAISDSCPIIYLLDKNGNFWIYDIKSQRVEKVKYVGGIGEETGKFLEPKDMVVCKNVLYVIDKNRLQAFSLITWQVIWVVGPQEDTYGHKIEGFEPKSLAIDEFQNIYVLDGSKNRVLKFNLAGQLKEIIWEGNLQNPLSLFVKDNTLYLLESSKIRKGIDVIDLPETIISPVTFSVNSKKNIYIGGDKFDENKGSLWGLSPEAELIDTVITYKRTCKKMLFDNKDDLWILDTSGTLSLIAPEKVYQETGEFQHIFDSTIPECKWHRLGIDSEVPEGTSLYINIVARDEIKKSDVYSGYLSLPSGSKDIFLPQIKGRYLFVKIKFQSDPQRKKSPVLNFIKVFFPKKTYLQYLPAIYQEDKESKDILERYLSIFQTILEDIEDKIEKTHLLIDPETTRGEFLNWLSSWVGLIKEERWSEEKWREFLGKAIEFFKMRGTREGLSNLIELFTGKKPIIIEPFQLECEKKSLRLGRFSFCVLLKPKQVRNYQEFEAVKRIVALWKPAHTEGKTVLLKEKMLLGDLLYLGINTYLNPPEFILGKAILPIDTKLLDIEDNAQIERHSRLGIDAKINF